MEDSWEFFAHEEGAQNGPAEVKTLGDGLFSSTGVGLLVADSNIGKTTWIGDMLRQWPCPVSGGEVLEAHALDPVTGKPVPMGWFFRIGLRALVVCFEDGGNLRRAARSYAIDKWRPARPSFNVRGHLEREVNGAHVGSDVRVFTPPSTFRLDLTCAASVEAFLDALYREADTYTQCNVLVLDCLALCVGSADVNADSTAIAAMRSLNYIRESVGAGLVIALHHTTAGRLDPRGSREWYGLADSVVALRSEGTRITALNTKARGFAKGTKKHYLRRVVEAADLNASGLPIFTRLEYDEVNLPAPTPPAATTAPAKAAEPARRSRGSATPARAADAPAQPFKEPPATAAPQHPADRLRGRPRAVWTVLKLKPGESVSLAEAKAVCIDHPCFADVPKDRLGDRWKEVVAAFANKGLVDTELGFVVNPR